jgi:class 3 adenylate cyclase
MDAVQDLIRHLRENPGDRDVQRLAVVFGLDPSLVETAVASVPTARGATERGRSHAPGLVRLLAKPWSLAVERPWRTLWLLAVANAVLTALSMALPDRSQALTAGLVAVSLLLLPGVMIAVATHHGSVKLAVGSAAIAAASFAVGSVRLSGPLPNTVAALLVTTLALALLYSLVAVPVSVLAGYRKVRREKAAHRAMTRQQMLARVFELRDQLRSDRRSDPVWSLYDQPVMVWLRHHVWWVAPLAQLGVSGLGSVLLWTADPNRLSLTDATRAGAEALVVSLLLTVLQGAMQFAFGLIAKRARLAVLLILLTNLVSWGSAALPGSFYSLADMAAMPIGQLLFGFTVFLMVGIAGALAGQIHEHAVTAKRTRDHDPETLLAELVELEWRLTPRATRTCVMVVDVAGSTALKTGADPFEAEWSFREYQNLVERVCERYRGKVHSTAGDGAVVGFPDSDAALAAAIAVQAEIETFNQTTNRLGPFRLRIGLHSGEVQGDLDQVQFTRVIDLAAHIESLCPVGGVAVSESVAAEVGRDKFDPFAQTADGHEAFALRLRA